MAEDEALRRGRALAYRLREDKQGHTANVVEALCDRIDQLLTEVAPDPPAPPADDPGRRAPSLATIAAAAVSGTLDELRPLPGEE